MTKHTDRDTRRVARSPPRAAQGGEGANAAQRRAGAATAGAAVGSPRQGVPIRDRRGHRLAARPLPRALAAPRLPLHVRARLQGGVSGLLDHRGWVRRLRRSPGQPRRDALGGVAGAAREAAGVQAADGWNFPWASSFGSDFNPDFNVFFTEEQQREGASNTTIGASRRGGTRRGMEPTWRGPCGRERGHDRNRRSHVHAREAGNERVRAGGRRRLPHLFRLCARTGWPLGHVPVARPRSQGTQRDGHLVAPP